MPDLPTRLEYFRIGADEVLTRAAARPPGQRIAPREVFTEGSDINIVIASASAMAEEVTRQLGLRIEALLLDGARGEDLDRLVKDRYSVEVVRKGARPARGTVVFTRTQPTLNGLIIPATTRLRSNNGTEFVLLADATIAPPPASQFVTATVEAVLVGTVGNVAADTIVTFVGGAPEPGLVVNNPAVMAGGADTETDASLRARARNFFKAARRGTAEALQFGALTVPGVAKATVFEATDPLTGLPTGEVFVYIADANGQANAALIQAVNTELLNWRAAGIPVIVEATTPRIEDIVFELLFQPGTDTNAVFRDVQNAVLSFVNLLPPGDGTTTSAGVLRRSDLLAIARSVPGTIVNADAVFEPAGDVVPGAGESIRTTLDRITLQQP